MARKDYLNDKLNMNKMDVQGLFNESFSNKSENEGEKENPLLAPTYSGYDLNIDPELVAAGLSAIAIRHMPQALKLSKGGCLSNSSCGPNPLSHRTCNNPSSIQPRSGFYDLHHPELMKLTWAKKLTPGSRKEAIERFFHEHASYHGPFCNSLHNPAQSGPSQQQSFILGDTISTCLGIKTSGFSKSIDYEKNNKDVNLVNYDKESFVAIMAPTQGQGPSIESIMWAQTHLKEVGSLESNEFQDGVNIRRGTGAGEEGELDVRPTLSCRRKEAHRTDHDESHGLEVQSEGNAVVHTCGMNGKELSLLNLLHRSPAMMNLATLDGKSSLQEVRVDGKEIALFNRLQETTKRETD